MGPSPRSWPVPLLAALACAATATPAAATPVAGKSVDVAPAEFAKAASVRCPGDAAFAKLTAPRQIPLGCEVDATSGALTIATARADGTTQTGRFTGDHVHFRITQDGDTGVVTLVGPPDCKRSSPALFADVQGLFRTVGRYGTATGTGVWRMEEGCDATTTFRADEGTLAIDDFPKRRTVSLSAGKAYTAGAKSICRRLSAMPAGNDYAAINITVSGVGCASAKRVLLGWMKRLPRYKGSKTRRFPASSAGWTFDSDVRDVDRGRSDATRGVAAMSFALVTTFAARP